MVKSEYIREELQMELKKIDYELTVCKVTDVLSINTESDFYSIAFDPYTHEWSMQ